VPEITRQVHLLRRTPGPPRPEDFRVVEVPMPELREGQVLVRNIWMSVDPYMRRSMDADGKDLEPWPIGGPLNGPSIGRVVASRHKGFTEGDLVESMSGWQEHFVSDGDAFVPYLSPDNALARRSANDARPRDYLGLCGIAAMTAYAGMARLSPAKPGDTVVISSGAGTVGSLACQIGKLKGLRVVTSAGTDAKVHWLRSALDVDAFNYKAQPIGEALSTLCPNGIDLVLENASPEHLSACLPLMNDLGAILITGFISVYSTGGKSPPIENFEFVLDKFLTLKCYRFMDSLDAYPDFVRDMVRWRAEGRLTLPETIHDGLDAAPAALASLFSGESFGKVLVRLANDADDLK
jgi:NADPH-dependent curcumin reductase CurA